MSFSVVIKTTGGGGIWKKGEGAIQTYITVRLTCALWFFQQGAVLAAAFVHCKVRSSHIQYSFTHSHIQINIHYREPPQTLRFCWTPRNATSPQYVLK